MPVTRSANKAKNATAADSLKAAAATKKSGPRESALFRQAAADRTLCNLSLCRLIERTEYKAMIPDEERNNAAGMKRWYNAWAEARKKHSNSEEEAEEEEAEPEEASDLETVAVTDSPWDCDMLRQFAKDPALCDLPLNRFLEHKKILPAEVLNNRVAKKRWRTAWDYFRKESNPKRFSSGGGTGGHGGLVDGEDGDDEDDDDDDDGVGFGFGGGDDDDDDDAGAAARGAGGGGGVGTATATAPHGGGGAAAGNAGGAAAIADSGQQQQQPPYRPTSAAAAALGGDDVGGNDDVVAAAASEEGENPSPLTDGGYDTALETMSEIGAIDRRNSSSEEEEVDEDDDGIDSNEEEEEEEEIDSVSASLTDEGEGSNGGGSEGAESRLLFQAVGAVVKGQSVLTGQLDSVECMVLDHGIALREREEAAKADSAAIVASRQKQKLLEDNQHKQGEKIDRIVRELFNE